MSHIDVAYSAKEDYGSQLYNWCQVQGTAVGADSVSMVNSCQSLTGNMGYSATELLTNPYVRFHSLKVQWENDTKFLSSTNEICMHSAYQQIIGMGLNAIPYIIEELLIMPNHWFWALKAITGQDPVPVSKRGRVKEMVKEWIVWWLKNKNSL